MNIENSLKVHIGVKICQCWIRHKYASMCFLNAQFYFGGGSLMDEWSSVIHANR